ncbi:protein-disulfide reductase DsbD family protein [Acidisoma sp. C75]
MTQPAPMAKLLPAWRRLPALARALLLPLALVLALALVCGPRPAAAAASQVSSTLNNQVSLLSDVDQVAPGQPFHIGLFFTLGQKWHIYWTNPGDAGAAPTMSLGLPQGGTAGPIQWPVPKLISDGPVTSYGYTRKMAPVLLPLTITPPKTLSGPDYTVTVAATWLVCKTICVPGSATFSLTLPVAAASRPAPEAAVFAAAEAHQPKRQPWQAWIAPSGKLSVQGAGIDPQSIAGAQFFPLDPGQINPDYAQRLRLRAGRLSLDLTFVPGFKPNQRVSGLLVLTGQDGEKTAGIIHATPGLPPPLPPSETLLGSLLAAVTSLRYLSLVGAALLGGLILNLMPCVFPVLAMKAAHLARMQSLPRGRLRRLGFAYGAGVVLSFLGVGALLLALRAGGAAAGWGFQFQSPAFVLAMIWLLFAVGLLFSGALQIGGRWMGLGQSLTLGSGLSGSFCTGVLAAVVATPCTAPFMGAAVAAALAGPPLPGLLVFAALGLGLALPMMLLGALPGFGRLLPKPGRWMGILGQALAFPIYATVLWLIWVASQQGGPSLVLAAGAGLILIAFAAWAGRLGGRVAQALALIAALGLVPILWEAHAAPAARPGGLALTAGAEPFSTARLAALRAAGRPAFVNLTAAWCLTCLVNDRVALDRPAVREGFRAEKVAYLVGDWTEGDPAITAFLKAHGRAGVPLYLYYPPDGRPPVVLPQILTPRLVISTIMAGRPG